MGIVTAQTLPPYSSSVKEKLEYDATTAFLRNLNTITRGYKLDNPGGSKLSVDLVMGLLSAHDCLLSAPSVPQFLSAKISKISLISISH